jgi:hypothetical protein
LGAEEGLAVQPATKGITYDLIITDTSFTKQSTAIYSGISGPIIGSTKVYVTDATAFTTGKSLYLGRGTINYEGPIVISSNYTAGIPNYVILSTPTTKYHNSGEGVVLAQGGTRTVSGGTSISTSTDNGSNAIKYSTLDTVQILDGETSITKVAAIAQTPGVSGNVSANSLVAFDSAPFTGAAVTNNGAVTNAVDRETEDLFRQRIKNVKATRNLGTNLAVTTAIQGAKASDENTSVVSSYIVTVPGGGSNLFIDDGTGYEEKFTPIGIDRILVDRGGGTQYLKLSNVPITEAYLISTNSAPFNITPGAELRVSVTGSGDFSVYFGTNQFKDITNATALEVVAAINSYAVSTFVAETTGGGNKIKLTPRVESTDWIQIATPLGLIDANTVFNFPNKKVHTLNLYKNNTALIKDTDYKLNRNTGDIKLTTPLTAGDIVTAGSDYPRAYLETVEFAAPYYRTLIGGIAGNLWFCVDGAASIINNTLPTTLFSVSANDDDTGTNNAQQINLIPSQPFNNALTGDFLILWDSAFASVGGFDIRGAYRLAMNGTVDIYIKRPWNGSSATLGWTTVTLNSNGYTIVRSKTIPQVLNIPAGTVYSPQSLVTLANTQLKGIDAYQVRTSSMRIATKTMGNDGDIRLVAVDTPGLQIPFIANYASNQSGQSLGFVDALDGFGTPEFDWDVIVKSQTMASSASGIINAAPNGTVAGPSGLAKLSLPGLKANYFNQMTNTSLGFYGPTQAAGRWNNVIGGSLNTLSLTVDSIDTTNSVRSPHDRVVYSNPPSFTPTDVLSVLVDNDTTNKQYNINMGYPVLITNTTVKPYPALYNANGLTYNITNADVGLSSITQLAASSVVGSKLITYPRAYLNFPIVANPATHTSVILQSKKAGPPTSQYLNALSSNSTSMVGRFINPSTANAPVKVYGISDYFDNYDSFNVNVQLPSGASTSATLGLRCTLEYTDNSNGSADVKFIFAVSGTMAVAGVATVTVTTSGLQHCHLQNGDILYISGGTVNNGRYVSVNIVSPSSFSVLVADGGGALSTDVTPAKFIPTTSVNTVPALDLTSLAAGMFMGLPNAKDLAPGNWGITGFGAKIQSVSADFVYFTVKLPYSTAIRPYSGASPYSTGTIVTNAGNYYRASYPMIAGTSITFRGFVPLGTNNPIHHNWPASSGPAISTSSSVFITFQTGFAQAMGMNFFALGNASVAVGNLDAAINAAPTNLWVKAIAVSNLQHYSPGPGPTPVSPTSIDRSTSEYHWGSVPQKFTPDTSGISPAGNNGAGAVFVGGELLINNATTTGSAVTSIVGDPFSGPTLPSNIYPNPTLDIFTATERTEDFASGNFSYIVPNTPQSINNYLNNLSTSGLPSVCTVDLSNRSSKQEIITHTVGSVGGVSLLNTSANNSTAIVVDYPQYAPGGILPYIRILTSQADGFKTGQWVSLENSYVTNYPSMLSTTEVIDTTPSGTTNTQITISTAGMFSQTTNVLDHITNTYPLTLEKHGKYSCIYSSTYAAPGSAFAVNQGSKVTIQSVLTDINGQFVTSRGIANTYLAGSGVNEYHKAAMWIDNDTLTTIPQPGAGPNLTRIAIFDGLSATLGDTITISGDIFGTSNNGTYPIVGYSFVEGVAVSNIKTIFIKGVLGTNTFSGNPTGKIHLKSGLPTRTINKIAYIVPDSTTGYYRVGFCGNSGMAEVSASLGTVMHALDKPQLQTTNSVGTDAYQIYTGLIAECNRILYGVPDSPTVYPGILASGTEVEINGPKIVKIALTIAIRIGQGTASDVSSKVQNAVASLINQSPMGKPIALSQIIKEVQNVPEVLSAVMVSPAMTTTTDVLSVKDSEKPLVLNVQDIVVDVLVN